MKSHKNLDGWKKSIEFVTELYSLTNQYPKIETYGLRSQIRRAAISIPSNVAEGASRGSKKEYVRYLYIALSSAMELETQLIISEKLKYINKEQGETILEKLSEIMRIIQGLIKRNKALI